MKMEESQKQIKSCVEKQVDNIKPERLQIKKYKTIVGSVKKKDIDSSEMSSQSLESEESVVESDSSNDQPEFR